jgi:sortase (surface protein transpeptidase)
MSFYWQLAIMFAAAIVAGLSLYAWKLLMQLKQQRKTQLAQKKQQQLQQHLALQKLDKKTLESVVVIVRAMKEEQCDFSEGCWRLCVLLDSLKLSSSLAQQFPAIFSLYNKIKHLDILESRKTLEKQQRMKQDLERMKAEAALFDDIKKDLEPLHNFANEHISLLGINNKTS